MEVDEHLWELYLWVAHWLLGTAWRGCGHYGCGLFSDTRGVNPRAIVALVAGVVVALIGLAVPALRFLYDYAWFVGFFVSAASYYSLMPRHRVDTSVPLSAVTRSGTNE